MSLFIYMYVCPHWDLTADLSNRKKRREKKWGEEKKRKE